MKAALRTVQFVVVLYLMLSSLKPVMAQCAQCAATVATNNANGGNTANGLNAGILFLLAAPFMAVGIAGFVWHKNYQKKNVNIDMPSPKLHLN